MWKLSPWAGCEIPDAERFCRFEELARVDLAKVRLYDGTRWLPRSVGAIALSVPLYSRLFGSAGIYLNCRRGVKATARHLNTLGGIELLAEELYHLKQQRETGALKFYVSYLWEYFQHRRRGLSKFAAYNAISFEREAKAFAQRAAQSAAGDRYPAAA